MTERRSYLNETDIPSFTWIQKGYGDGVALFSLLRDNFDADAEEKYDVWQYSGVNSSDLQELMNLTHQGFMITSKWPDLQREGAEPRRFYRQTMQYPAARDFTKPYKSGTLQSPEKPMVAYNHAKTVLMLLKSRSMLGKHHFDLMMEDLGLMHEPGETLESFLDVFDQQQTMDPDMMSTWKGTGTTESIVHDIRRLHNSVKTAASNPSQLKGREVTRGYQFFALGKELLTQQALGGHNLVLQAEISDEIEEYLSAAYTLHE